MPQRAGFNQLLAGLLEDVKSETSLD
jgi:hypothetical protein